MKYDLENQLSYALLAILALAVFYGIYFAKMLAQKRRGIQTRQIGRRKENGLYTVETVCLLSNRKPDTTEKLECVR